MQKKVQAVKRDRSDLSRAKKKSANKEATLDLKTFNKLKNLQKRLHLLFVLHSKLNKLAITLYQKNLMIN